MLAAIALTLCSVVLFRMKRERYAFVALVPAAWLYLCTLTAGLEKIFQSDPRIGFLAHARRFSDALARDELLRPRRRCSTCAASCSTTMWTRAWRRCSSPWC